MSHSFQYSEFVLSNEEMQNKEQMSREVNLKRRHLIESHVKKNGLVELKSDYLGMDSFYYDTKTKTMYKVTNVCGWGRESNPTFEVSNDQHILKLNSLL